MIKSCLKTLHELGVANLIQNVTFMGGAIDRLDKNEAKLFKWSTIFSEIVNGEIRNVYTKKDVILVFFQIREVASS